MNMNETLNEYPVEESTRAMIEQALGFTPTSSGPEAPVTIPTTCMICQGNLEHVHKEESDMVRCSRCGSLSSVVAHGGLQPIIVVPPGGGWNAEFQARFEKNLGFTYKVRKKPIGIPE